MRKNRTYTYHLWSPVTEFLEEASSLGNFEKFSILHINEWEAEHATAIHFQHTNFQKLNTDSAAVIHKESGSRMFECLKKHDIIKSPASNSIEEIAFTWIKVCCGIRVYSQQKGIKGGDSSIFACINHFSDLHTVCTAFFRKNKKQNFSFSILSIPNLMPIDSNIFRLNY